MAGDNNTLVSSIREKMSANHEFNLEQFDDTVVEQVMQILENMPPSAHNEAIEQFLFEYYFGNKSQPSADADGNISQQRLEQLAAQAHLIEISLKLRDQSFSLGPGGSTVASICMDKFLRIGRYLLTKWESYKGNDGDERINELREAEECLTDSARVYNGTSIPFEAHQGFVHILNNMEYVDTILPLPSSQSKPSPTE